MRLEDAVELGRYEPADPRWLATVGETLTFQGADYTIARPAQPSGDPSTSAGDLYVQHA
jgi:hypothetical protein